MTWECANRWPRRSASKTESVRLSATLGLVGEWWTVLILHDVFDGYHRFDQFQANLGISSSLLTTRLRRLVDAGILTKHRYQDHPPRYEYHLTELGRSLRPVLVVLAAWGNSRLEPDARSMVLVDADTGIEADPVVVDRATGRRARRARLRVHRRPRRQHRIHQPLRAHHATHRTRVHPPMLTTTRSSEPPRDAPRKVTRPVT